MGNKPSRHGSALRTIQNADFADILHAISQLDEANVMMPTFVPVKLDRLPRYDPEEVNVFALIDRLLVLEREMTNVKQDVASMKSISIPSAVSTGCSADTDSSALYAQVVKLPPLSSSCFSATSSAVDMKTIEKKSANANRSTNAAMKDILKQKGQTGVSHQHAHIKTAAEIKADDDFVTVSNRRRVRRDKDTVVGTKKDVVFHGCRPRVDLFISRIPREYDIEAVRNMVKDTGLEILSLDKVSHVDAHASSFKLTIYKDEEEKARAASVWPEYVECRRFWQKRHRAALPTLKSSGYDDWSQDDMTVWDPLPDTDTHHG